MITRITVNIIMFLIFSSFIVPKKDVEAIRKNPSCSYSIYNKHKTCLQREVPKLSSDELFIVFCAMTAYSMAPYGDCQSQTLTDMLHAPTLHCGKYGIVMMGIATAAVPNIEERVKVHAVGWNNGLWGDHQTLFIHRSFDDGIFIDPTCGVLAYASFNHIACGKPVAQKNIYSFAHRKDLIEFQMKVYKTLREGLCQPSQINNYFGSVFLVKEWFDHYYIDQQHTPTPAAQSFH